MKLIHISDLHLGKRIHEYSLLEDQAFILQQILHILDDEQAEGVLLAGDVYDKTIPPAEAVSLFDDFLCALAKRNCAVFVISGNHDSPERLAFGARIMDADGIYLSPVYHGTVEPVCLQDAFGELRIYMLPFVKPALVRGCFAEEPITTYTDAVDCAVRHMHIDREKRNLLITHQFVTGASRSESEELSVGGTDNVDARVFDGFDYVALGHLHSPQTCASPTIRYCGTPLKYSFSEAKDQKSVTVVELLEKGHVSCRTVDLLPLHDMVELKGTYEMLTRRSYYEQTTWQEDYTHIILTDEEDIPDAIGKLRAIYHRLVRLEYDNKRTRFNAQLTGAAEQQAKHPLELVSEFYRLQNNQDMSETQHTYMQKLIEQIWEENQ